MFVLDFKLSTNPLVMISNGSRPEFYFHGSKYFIQVNIFNVFLEYAQFLVPHFIA